jgi:hypothetical protein
MCCLYVKLHKGDMWQQDDDKPNLLLSSIVNKKITSRRWWQAPNFSLFSATYEKEKEDNDELKVHCCLL